MPNKFLKLSAKPKCVKQDLQCFAIQIISMVKLFVCSTRWRTKQSSNIPGSDWLFYSGPDAMACH